MGLASIALLVASGMAPGMVSRMIPLFVGMGRNTMLAFALSGLALWAFDKRCMPLYLGLLVCALATVALIQPFLGLNPERAYWSLLLNVSTQTEWVGRMSWGTAVAFLAAGGVLIHLPRARGGTSLILIHCLLGTLFLMAFLGLLGHALDISMFARRAASFALMSLPTSIGLILLSAGLYLKASLSEGLGRYYRHYPDRRILAIAVFVMLVLLLAGGLASGGIVGRYAVRMLERGLSDSLQMNVAHFTHEVEHAKSFGELVLRDLASVRSKGETRTIELEQATGQLGAIWRKDATGARIRILGEPIASPAFETALDMDGATRLLWHKGWLVQMRRGDLVAQIHMKGLDRTLHYKTVMGAEANLFLAIGRKDGINYVAASRPDLPLPSPAHEHGATDVGFTQLDLALRGESGTLFTRDHEGRPVLAAYAPLFGGRLAMSQQVETDDLFQYLIAEFWKVVLLLLLMALVGSLLLYRHILPLARRLRETQSHLTESLRKNELILRCAGEGIYGMDREGRCTFVNPAAERLLGYDLADLSGTSIHRIIHHSKRDGTPYPVEECPLNKTLSDGTPIHVDSDVFWRKDGRPLDVEYISAPILDADEVSGAVVVFGDITQRRIHEATLARWQHIFEHAEWGVIVGGADGKYLELMNPAFARMHGYGVEELLGRPITDVFVPECHEQLAENIRITHEKGHHVWESWHLRKDGSRFPVQLDATAVKDAHGKVLYRVVNVQDITERRKAEDTLRESEAHLARAQAQGKLGSWSLDIRSDVLCWSRETYRIFGIPVDTPLDTPRFLACVHPDDRAYVERTWEASLSSGNYDIQHRIIVDGEVKWVRERAEMEFDSAGGLSRGIGTVQDITELKYHENELLRSRQSLRELAAHHEKIREEERARIAREIHDELGQYLTALRMDTAMLNIRYGQGNHELEAFIVRMKQTIDTTIAVVRDIAAALRPGALDMGLISATEWLLGQFGERTGIRCKLDIPGEEPALDNERATAAFRILQESLTNITRYAQASAVTVSIRVQDAVLFMEVRDDGVGFDPLEVRGRKTFGLMGIRERALMFGGESKIESALGQGTVLNVRIPLEKEVP